MDRVDASGRASVTTHRAARSSTGLSRRVVHTVTRTGTAALEGVVQTEPVADLVGGRLAKVVVGGATAGDRRRQDGAAVVIEVVGAGADVVGEVAVAGRGRSILEKWAKKQMG